MEFTETGQPICTYGETIEGRVCLNVYTDGDQLYAHGYLTYAERPIGKDHMDSEETEPAQQEAVVPRYITQETTYAISTVSVDSGLEEGDVDTWADFWIDKKTGALTCPDWETTIEPNELLKPYHQVIKAAAHVAIASTTRY